MNSFHSPLRRVDCPTVTTNTSTGTISYSPGSLYFDPPIPPSFSDVGTYSYTALMDGLPSDTNCPPIATSLGTFTVEVVDTSFTNVTVQCCSVTNGNTLMLTNVICLGDPLNVPSITNLADFFIPGQIVRSEFDCYYGTTNHFTNAVTYSPQVRFDPPLPTGPITTPGEQSFTIHVDGISSTNACPNLTVQAGSFTVFASKMTIGLGTTNVFVNADDDNGNATNDVNEALSGPDSAVTGENDLVSLSLGAQGAAPGQTATLSVSGNVRLWASSTRGPGAPLLDAAYGANSVT